MVEERNSEVLFRQKEINQRIKEVAIGPLSKLDSESRLADKFVDIKLTPEQIFFSQEQELQF